MAKLFREKQTFPVPELEGYTCVLETDELLGEYRVTVKKQDSSESVSTFTLKKSGEEGKEREYLELKLKQVFELEEPDIIKVFKQIAIIQLKVWSKTVEPYPYIPPDPYKTAKQAAETKIVGEDELVDQIHHIFLSAYTSNPLNGCIRAPTAEGKTYPSLSIARLYPPEDLLIYAGASPKSFIHDNGVLVNEKYESVEDRLKTIDEDLNTIRIQRDSKEIDAKEYVTQRTELTEEKRELLRNAKTLIDFENKILLLLDAPPKDLWDNLKTLLSHDKYFQEFKFVNSEQGIRTEHVVFKGSPAFLFCTARDESKLEIWEEIKTRVMIMNPRMNPEKYREVFRYIAAEYKNPWRIIEQTPELQIEQECKAIIQGLKQVMIGERQALRSSEVEHDPRDESIVWIPYADLIAENYKADKGGRQREIKQFLQLIATHACWNLTDRRWLTRSNSSGKTFRFIVAEPEDYFFAEKTFQVQGIPPFKHDFYRNIFYPCYLHHNKEPISITELKDYHNKQTGKKMTGANINNNYLSELEKEGYVEDLGVNPELHRQKHWWKPLIKIQTEQKIDEPKKPILEAITVDLTPLLTKQAINDLIKPLLNMWQVTDYRNRSNETTPDQDKPVTRGGPNNGHGDIRSHHVVLGSHDHDSDQGSPITVHPSNNQPPSEDRGSNNRYSGFSNGFSVESDQKLRLEKLVELGRRFKDRRMLKVELMFTFGYGAEEAERDLEVLRKAGVL